MNMYPVQDEGATHNAYTTVLALQALLDARAAALPWSDQATPDEMIRRAEAWLVANFRSDGVEAGWAGAPPSVVEVETSVLDGLSYQAFATLLRAEEETGIALPAPLVGAMADRLLGAADRAPEYRKEESDFPTKVAGRYEKEGIQFTWYPWALEASVRWLARTKRTPEPPDRVRAVRRIVSRIVTGNDGRFLRHAVSNERKTYEAAEHLLALAQLR